MHEAVKFFVPALFSIILYKIMGNYIQGHIHVKEISSALLVIILFFVTNKIRENFKNKKSKVNGF